jgi:DNA-binding response OmpR family regulator
MLESTLILIVTPDATLASSLYKAFSEYRYQVILIKDERAGVEQALQNLPSVILVDRRNLSFDQLRRQAQLRVVPIVAVQMRGVPCDKDQCAARLVEGLEACIHSLRRKIEPDASSPRLITTIRGVGYKLQVG